MKLHKKLRPELVASSDPTRTALVNSYLDITAGVGTLVATNGRSIVCLPVGLEPGDTAGYVSERVLKAARKMGKPREDGAVALTDKATFPDGATLPRAEGTGPSDSFPNWRQVVPKTPEKPVFKIAINAKLLWELAQSMGVESVSLTAANETGEVRAVLVAPAEQHAPTVGARGVLMLQRWY